MDYVITEETTFTPDVDGNLQEADPVTVRLRYATPAVRQSAFATRMEQRGGDSVVVVEIDARALLMAVIVDIHNLKANGREIKTARGLVNTPGMDPWVTAITDHAISMNPIEDANELKN